MSCTACRAGVGVGVGVANRNPVRKFDDRFVLVYMLEKGVLMARYK